MIQINSREQLQSLIAIVGTHANLLGLKTNVKETMTENHRRMLAACLTLKDQATIDEQGKDALSLASLEKEVRKGKKGKGNRPQPNSMSGKIRAYVQRNNGIAPGKAGYDALRQEYPELTSKSDGVLAAMISSAKKVLKQ
jgi:hypothetical protein